MSDRRNLAVVVGAISAIALFLLYQPWVALADPVTPALTAIFWVAFLALLVVLYLQRGDPDAETIEIEGPALARFYFGDTRAGLFWLPIRIFVGFEWMLAGWEKLTGTGWVDGGSTLLGYWQRAVAIPETGRPPISFDWYRTFLQFLIDNNAQGWFAWIITLGELAVGIGLLVGALVGFAAFFGATMNMSYMLAGSASTNPILFAMAVGLILAWRVAGWYGLDRFLLPLLGTPWTRRSAVTRSEPARSPATTS